MDARVVRALPARSVRWCVAIAGVMSLLFSGDPPVTAAGPGNQPTEQATIGTGSPSIVRQITLPDRSTVAPQPTAAQRVKLDAATNRSGKPDAPVSRDPSAAVRPGPPAATPTDPQARQSDGPAADADFVAYKNVALNISGQNGSTSTTDEPSVASNGSTIFYTGNWYAAVSTNAGDSFTYLNPYSDFPSVSGGSAATR